MSQNKREMKKQLKRTMWFLAGFGCVALIISALLIIYTTIPQWLNMLVIIVLAGASYLVFLWICDIIDKKKKEKELENPPDDPFAD